MGTPRAQRIKHTPDIAVAVDAAISLRGIAIYKARWGDMRYRPAQWADPLLVALGSYTIKPGAMARR